MPRTLSVDLRGQLRKFKAMVTSCNIVSSAAIIGCSRPRGSVVRVSVECYSDTALRGTSICKTGCEEGEECSKSELRLHFGEQEVECTGQSLRLDLGN